jgi:hypothetical protein
MDCHVVKLVNHTHIVLLCAVFSYAISVTCIIVYKVLCLQISMLVYLDELDIPCLV